jgi:hypothetical protein
LGNPFIVVLPIAQPANAQDILKVFVYIDAVQKKGCRKDKNKQISFKDYFSFIPL